MTTNANAKGALHVPDDARLSEERAQVASTVRSFLDTSLLPDDLHDPHTKKRCSELHGELFQKLQKATGMAMVLTMAFPFMVAQVFSAQLGPFLGFVLIMAGMFGSTQAPRHVARFFTREIEELEIRVRLARSMRIEELIGSIERLPFGDLQEVKRLLVAFQMQHISLARFRDEAFAILRDDSFPRPLPFAEQITAWLVSLSDHELLVRWPRLLAGIDLDGESRRPPGSGSAKAEVL